MSRLASAPAFAQTAPDTPALPTPPDAPAPLTLRALLDSLATFAVFAALGLVAALLLASCSATRTEAAPERSSSPARAMPAEPTAPSLAVSPIAADRLCVTKGAASIGATVTQPTMRAVALGSSGDAASLAFVFRGDTATSRELASGESRRQLGLKLRAQDGCNLLYVMWRLDPKPSLSVSLKRNPGQRTHRECGARGYTRLRPTRGLALAPVPALAPGASHTLRAEIAGGDLLAWIDDQLVWRGPLPATARDLAGPAGLRSDNVRFDLVSFSAAPAPAPASASPDPASSPAATSARCSAETSD
jgi:hypothetical protein